MKKILALTLLLVLAAPVVGWACSCCIHEEASSSSLSTIGTEDCCCPGTDLKSDHRDVARLETANLLPSNIFTSHLFLLIEEALSKVDSSETPFDFKGLAPPGFSQETPLYLVHRILLI
ncbi:MAG: hypothetical protein HY447_00180 [Candidatus Omnitrophica bacterium]|nr:hypothetical protein [Candidatus Omnitrophota bacterium]